MSNRTIKISCKTLEIENHKLGKLLGKKSLRTLKWCFESKEDHDYVKSQGIILTTGMFKGQSIGKDDVYYIHGGTNKVSSIEPEIITILRKSGLKFQLIGDMKITDVYELQILNSDIKSQQNLSTEQVNLEFADSRYVKLE